MSRTPTPYLKMEEPQTEDKPLPPPPPMNKPKTCCRSCLCISLLILTLSLLAFYFFSVSNPRVPSYTVQDLQVTAFEFRPDSTFQTNFLATIKADNPNGNIGFIYGEGSSVNVTYQGTEVCSGKLPHFRQGPMNVTVMKVDLVGGGDFGSGLQQAYGKNSPVPLLVKVKVPVRIVVGQYPLREVMVFVNCSLLVDSLALDMKMNIVTTNMTFNYEF